MRELAPKNFKPRINKLCFKQVDVLRTGLFLLVKKFWKYFLKQKIYKLKFHKEK